MHGVWRSDFNCDRNYVITSEWQCVMFVCLTVDRLTVGGDWLTDVDSSSRLLWQKHLSLCDQPTVGCWRQCNTDTVMTSAVLYDWMTSALWPDLQRCCRNSTICHTDTDFVFITWGQFPVLLVNRFISWPSVSIDCLAEGSLWRMHRPVQRGCLLASDIVENEIVVNICHRYSYLQ